MQRDNIESPIFIDCFKAPAKVHPLDTVLERRNPIGAYACPKPSIDVDMFANSKDDYLTETYTTTNDSEPPVSRRISTTEWRVSGQRGHPPLVSAPKCASARCKMRLRSSMVEDVCGSIPLGWEGRELAGGLTPSASDRDPILSTGSLSNDGGIAFRAYICIQSVKLQIFLLCNSTCR